MLSEAKHGEGLKIITPKQIIWRLQIALAQVKAGNTSENLLNEIRQIVYSLYRANQPFNFMSKNCFEKNDDTHGTYNKDRQIKSHTSMLKSSLFDYSGADIFVKGTITVAPAPVPAANLDNNNKEVVFKICAPFIDFIRKINNTQIYNAKDIHIVIAMYNLI